MFDKVVDAALSLWDKFQIEGTYFSYTEEPGEVHFEVRTASIDAILVAKFSLSKMPGTLWLYSHGACVTEQFRGQGIGKRMNEFRKRIAESAGAWGLLAFVAGSNTTQRNLLSKQGWMRIGNFSTIVSEEREYIQEIWVVLSENFGTKERKSQ